MRRYNYTASDFTTKKGGSGDTFKAPESPQAFL